MAKIIACPTCGENVDVPPGSAGQVIKCSACGTAIKLVSRKKANPTPGTSNNESAIGTILGSTFNGYEDLSPPSLGECAQCGSVLADPSKLVEDRGRLICPNCAAKSPVTQREDVHSYRPRPGDAAVAPTIGFKEPETVVARHGPFVSLGLMTFGGFVAGAVAIGASIWLTFNPRPIGTIDPFVKPLAVVNVTPPVPPPTEFPDAERSEIIDAVLVRAAELVKRGDAEGLSAALDLYKGVTTKVGARETSDSTLKAAIDTARRGVPDLEQKIAALKAPPPEAIVVAPQPTPIEPPLPKAAVVPPPVATQPDPTTKPEFIFAETADDIVDTTDLLSLGMHALKINNYELARDSFLKAQKQLGGRDVNEQYQPEQVFAMHGLGAANLGLNQAKPAYDQLNRAYKNTPPSPQLKVNWCLANYLLDQQRPESLLALESALQQQPTETGVDLMQAMMTKWGRSLNADMKARFEKARTSALNRLEVLHPKEKRWGDTWISAEEYDERVRNEVLISVLSEKVSVLNQEVRRAEMAYRAAQDLKRDVDEKKTRLDKWKEDLEKVQKELEVTQANVPVRAVKTGMNPVIPEVPAGVLLRE